MSAGTKALLTYGAKAATNVAAFAASTLRASRPKHAASHEIAVISASSRPATASQFSGSATGRKPASSATPSTSTVETTLRATLAATWPVSTAAHAIGSERKRSITPVVMSSATATAVPAEPKPAHSTMIPGTT